MNTTTAYTPLECLLLFQSLVAFGTEEQEFDRISNLLTNNTLVKDGPTYDAQRLTSEALRNQYLQLLRDELSSEEHDEDADGTSSTSKKRKIPSPPLPSLADAQEHREKLPLLVDRLYARYRDYIVREIREEERRYADLKKEIEEIERGEWDERLGKEDGALANGNGVNSAEQVQPKTNGVSTEPVCPAVQQETESSKPSIPSPRLSPPPVPSQPEPQPEPAAVNDVSNPPQPLPTSSPKIPDQPRANSQSLPSPNHQRTGSNGHPAPPPVSGPQHPGHLRWEPPFAAPNNLQPYQPPYPPYNSPQYASQPYPPPPPQRGSFPSPNSLPPPHSTVPSSPGHFQHPPPVLLPPSNGGVRRSPGSPGMPLDALADAAGQQYRAPSGSPMVAQQGLPPPQGYFQQYPSQQRPPSAGGPPPWPPQPPQPFHHSQPPYQGSPTQRTQFQPQPALIQPENRQYNSPYNPSQGPRPQTQAQRLQSLPSTPISRGSPHLFTGSGTRWTPTPTGATPGTYVQLPRPEMEPLSPILKPIKPFAATMKSESKPKSPKALPRGTKRTRAPSTTSSVIPRSHRSQSVMSHADELSMDNEPPGRRVKEEVATPAGISDTGDTTADDSSTLPRPNSRAGPPARQSTKRKRGQNSIFDTRPPSHVLWTKNFPNISKSALENISADKNASIFSAPVKERDAPGYKTLILRPQDLKSIRVAITAGHRAASSAAAPEDMNSNLTSAWLPISEDLVPPKGIINTAQLEQELMRMFANAVMFNPDPNRGFGKQWQAIGAAKGDPLGYAFDEDSVVKSTRAMFADVEKIVGDLRAAERRSEETRENSLARANIEDDEVDELAGDGEPHVGSVAKRRKKA